MITLYKNNSGLIAKTTNSYHHFHKYNNLIKELEITKPNQVWVSDNAYGPSKRLCGIQDQRPGLYITPTEEFNIAAICM